jgi:two-component system phosphate regulon sensor histidine kinase PhoR
MDQSTLPNAIVFNSPIELLAALLFLALLVAVLAWACYRLGRSGERSWRALLARLPLGVGVYDTAGRRMTFANPLAHDMLGQLDPTVLDQTRQAAQQHQQLSWTIGGDDRSVHIQSWLLDERGRQVALVLQDRTAQQQREAGQRAFIQALGHELQTPLTAIQGHLAYIASSVDRNGANDWRGSLQVVHDEINRLAWLTPNLLTLLKLDTGQALNRRPHHLGVLAEEVAQQLWEQAAARKISLRVHTQPGLARVSVDRSAWKQVFLNLIDNGIKYGVEGGSVTVTLQQSDTEQILTIVDDGPGVDPRDLPYLFDTLYRAEQHQQIQGSGLGLAIVRQIVELHGGQITCQNDDAVGHGAIFRITLPLAPYVM